jgi:hypothetical protein
MLGAIPPHLIENVRPLAVRRFNSADEWYQGKTLSPADRCYLATYICSARLVRHKVSRLVQLIPAVDTPYVNGYLFKPDIYVTVPTEECGPEKHLFASPGWGTTFPTSQEFGLKVFASSSLHNLQDFLLSHSNTQSVGITGVCNGTQQQGSQRCGAHVGHPLSPHGKRSLLECSSQMRSFCRRVSVNTIVGIEGTLPEPVSRTDPCRSPAHMHQDVRR